MKSLHKSASLVLMFACSISVHVTPLAQTVVPTPPATSAEPSGKQQDPGMAGMDHSDMNHQPGTAASKSSAQDAGKGPIPAKGAKPAMDMGSMQGMNMGQMQGMQMGPMQGGRPPPNARDPNAYAEGARRSDLGGMEMADNALVGSFLVNNLEYTHSRHENGQNLDAEAWYGGDYNKAWFKAEGERRGGRLESLRTEVLWDRIFSPFWSTQLGVRHDTGGGDARTWLAFGVQGLAPYWFETEATGYWRGGAFAARIDLKYELLFTQRLILEPQFGANVYSKADPKRGTGAGLSDVEFGLRLRYEIRRQFAPYIGISWKRKFGGTAGFASMAGMQRQTTEAVAGVRMWF
jgi:copper resistance protein B